LAKNVPRFLSHEERNALHNAMHGNGSSNDGTQYIPAVAMRYVADIEGHFVVIGELTSERDLQLNGCIGLALEYLPETDRWRIEIKKQGVPLISS
jgi:hypothetical protein